METHFWWSKTLSQKPRRREWEKSCWVEWWRKKTSDEWLVIWQTPLINRYQVNLSFVSVCLFELLGQIYSLPEVLGATLQLSWVQTFCVFLDDHLDYYFSTFRFDSFITFQSRSTSLLISSLSSSGYSSDAFFLISFFHTVYWNKDDWVGWALQLRRLEHW